MAQTVSWRVTAPLVTAGLAAVTVLGLLALFPETASASWWRRRPGNGPVVVEAPAVAAGGSWHWMRSPEQEQRVISAHYDRYCVRCHGVDGRGVWDIPDVPDLASRTWQASRTEDQLVRGILEGRGACMPAFRGTLTLDECWAMARYLRTFVPGNQTAKPNTQEESKTPKKEADAK